MGDGKNTARDSDYCPSCKVKIMDDTCFCDWPDNEQIEYDKHCEERLSRQYDEQRKAEFQEKIRSISFSRVRRGRG